MVVSTSRRRARRTGLVAVLAASMVASAAVIALSGAGPAAAEPPQNAVDNHHESNASPNDNSVLDDYRPPAPPPPVVVKPTLVKITPQAATVFDPSKYEGILPCGASATESGDGTEPDVSVERLSDATSGACEPAPYALTNTANGLEFIKADGQPFAQFFLTVVWPSDNGNLDEKQTGVDFGLVSGGYEFVMPWCPVGLRAGKDEAAPVIGLPEGTTDPTPEELLALGIYDMDGLPRAARVTDEGVVLVHSTDEDNGVVQYACVGSRDVHVVPATGTEGAYYAFTEEIFLLGDVKMRTL
jgi:hypothetical protein